MQLTVALTWYWFILSFHNDIRPSYLDPLLRPVVPQIRDYIEHPSFPPAANTVRASNFLPREDLNRFFPRPFCAALGFTPCIVL